MEIQERQTSAPSTRPTGPGAVDQVGAAGTVRTQQRAMSFAAGEAVTTPNEAKGRKPRGQVDLGTGPEVTSLADAPVGEATRLAAMVDAADPTRRDVDVWPPLLQDNLELLEKARGALEVRFIAQQTHVPTTAAFREKHALAADRLQKQLVGVSDAISSVNVVGLVAAPSLSMVAMAQRDLEALGIALEASGCAIPTEDGVAVDGARVARESEALQVASEEAGRSLSVGADRGEGEVETALVSLRGGARQMGACAMKLRARRSTDMAQELQGERERLEARLAVADSIDGLVAQLWSATPIILQILEPDAAGSADLGELVGGHGLLARLIAGGDVAELENVRRRIAAYQGLAKAEGERAEAMDIEAQARNFGDGLMTVGRAIDRFVKNAATRRHDLGVLGKRLDREARSKGDLTDGEERFAPVAERTARVEKARATVGLARQELGLLGEDAARASDAIVAVTAAPTSDTAVYDALAGLGPANVPARLARRIHRLERDLAQGGAVLEASTPKEMQ